MEMNQRVLASVNGNVITDADVDEMLAQMGQRGQAYNNEQGRAMILEQLIAQKLFLVDAKKNLVEYEPAFKAELARVKDQMLAQYAVNKIVAAVKVTDDEAKKFFDENPKEFEGEETVTASHILVDSEDKCNEILAEINAGSISFEDAAKKYSSCPSGKNGGSLGAFGHGQMVPEFDQACFSMEIGETRGPIKTQFGYHLIRLDDKGTSEPVSFAQAKEQIKQSLLREKQQKAYQSRVNQLKILYPVDR